MSNNLVNFLSFIQIQIATKRETLNPSKKTLTNKTNSQQSKNSLLTEKLQLKHGFFG